MIAPLRSLTGLLLLFLSATASVAETVTPDARVAALPYRVVPDFFQWPKEWHFGEVSGVAIDSRGHIFVFQRTTPMLSEFDGSGKFLREIGAGLFTHPHGLRIDAEDSIWTTDDGSHLVLKLDHDGRPLLVLGRKGVAAEADWLFNEPADVAFDKEGNIYVSDGYGNSRVMKFDRTGRFLKSWGSYGSKPGQFDLPHTILIDNEERVYVGDRENKRIQIFNAEGKFLKQWTGIGYPYGLCFGPGGHIWMADGGYDRIVELDETGKIIGAIGEPGHAPGQFAWAHFLAFAAGGRLFVADVLNWRVDVFVPTSEQPGMSSYMPTRRMFWDQKPSNGWENHHSNAPLPKKTSTPIP
jgi:DNA-binding beta-propeller fold protein YncE